MARREVLVQLDDELIANLDDLARRRGVSRSALLRQGALAVLEADELAAADAQLRQAYRRHPQDPLLVETARRLAGHTAPPW